MTDLHTHILPGMDDGAQDASTAIAMLRRQSEQGVTAVALTPHFYPERESVEEFLSRREASVALLHEAILALDREERQTLPKLCLGAEVAWVSGIVDLAGLETLCYSGTRLLLLELPFQDWTPSLFRALHELMNRRALTPVIAHIDRYFNTASHFQLSQLLSIGLPAQVSAASLEHFLLRRRVLQLLRGGEANLLISDCHDMALRRPNVAQAYQTVANRFGRAVAEQLEAESDALLCDCVPLFSEEGIR